jgi:hypothetical protein
MSSDPEAEIRASVGAHHDLGSGYSDAVAEGLVERIGAEIDKRIDARIGQLGAPWSPQFGPQPLPPPFGPPLVGPPFVAQPLVAQPLVASPPFGPAPPGVPVAVPEASGPPETSDPVPGPGPGGRPGYQGYQAPAGYPPGGYPGYQGHPGYQGYYGPMLPPGYQVPTPGSRPPSPSVGQHNVAMTIIALGSMALGVAGTAIVSRAANTGAQAVMVLLIWAAIAVINIAYARRR